MPTYATMQKKKLRETPYGLRSTLMKPTPTAEIDKHSIVVLVVVAIVAVVVLVVVAIE